jgi:hypothetical protein
VRWDDVFADLELEAAGLVERERDLEIAERTRAELATVGLVERFRAGVGRPVSLRVAGAGVLTGDIRRVTARWGLLAAPGDAEWLVAWSAVMGVTGLPPQAVDAGASRVESGLGWPATWRVLARDRAPVHVVRTDGSRVTGIASRVGRDFVELTASGLEHPTWVGGTRVPTEVVPYQAVAAVRCPGTA